MADDDRTYQSRSDASRDGGSQGRPRSSSRSRIQVESQTRARSSQGRTQTRAQGTQAYSQTRSRAQRSSGGSQRGGSQRGRSSAPQRYSDSEILRNRIIAIAALVVMIVIIAIVLSVLVGFSMAMLQLTDNFFGKIQGSNQSVLDSVKFSAIRFVPMVIVFTFSIIMGRELYAVQVVLLALSLLGASYLRRSWSNRNHYNGSPPYTSAQSWRTCRW